MVCLVFALALSLVSAGRLLLCGLAPVAVIAGVSGALGRVVGLSLAVAAGQPPLVLSLVLSGFRASCSPGRWSGSGSPCWAASRLFFGLTLSEH